MNRQTLTQKQTQTMRLSPAQILSIKMLEMSNLRLENAIRHEVDENPALVIEDEDNEHNLAAEEGAEYGHEEEFDHNDPMQDYYDKDDYDEMSDKQLDYEMRNLNLSKDDSQREWIITSDISLQDNLHQQLSELLLSDREQRIAEYIIGNIDESGYLTRDSRSLATDLLLVNNVQTSSEEIERIVRTVIQKMEPAGIGARNLQECLLLQLRRRPRTAAVNLACDILENHFEDFSKHQYNRIIQDKGIDQQTFNNALAEITSTDPRPAASASRLDMATNTIIPDFFINLEDGQLTLTLNNSHLPKLAIDDQFQQLYQQGDKTNKEVENFVKDNIDKANNFILALSQREATLLKTMSVIMNLQKNYFLTGDESELKPMILKDVATLTGLDVSTISRVSNSKYVQTYFGTIPVKHLFSEAVNEDISSKEIKRNLSELIKKEDKHNPLTDTQLCKLLEEKGYKIARRTIAKYREQLNIPAAKLRKEL